MKLKKKLSTNNKNLFKWNLFKIIDSHSLQMHVVAIFIIIMLITFSSIIIYSYSKNKESVMKVSEQFITHTHQTLVEKISLSLIMPSILAKFGGQTYNTPEEVKPNNNAIIDFMREALKSYSYLSAVYTMSVKGDYLMIKKISSQDTYYNERNKKLPATTNFMVHYINGSISAPTETIYYYDEHRKLLDTEVFPKLSSYNFQNQSWYADVLQSHVFEWSNLNILHTINTQLNKIGFTASYPVFREETLDVAGVFAFDLELSQITDLLDNTKITPNSTTMIINSKGEIIADSNDTNAITIEKDKIKTISINNMNDPKMVQAFEIFSSKNQPRFFFEQNGINYLCAISGFPELKLVSDNMGEVKLQHFEDWKIITILPSNDFVGPIVETQEKTLYVTFLIFTLAAFVISIIIKRVSTPILTLAQEATRIRKLELNSAVYIKSHIYELQLLNESIISMRSSMNAFSKFIPKALVEKLLRLQGDVRVGGKLKKVTFLFTDIANFTNSCVGYAPDKLANHLSEYFEEMTQLIMHNDGIIDKYIGDAIMAFWGAPQADKDQVANACQAALYMQKRLNDLNRKWEVEKKPVLPTRIGIHVGEAIVGNIGSSDRMNYTALGDTVNLASRLEGVNKFYKTNIIISEDAFHEVSHLCVARPLDIVAVKGRDAGIKIYELLGWLQNDPSLLPTKQQVEFCEFFTRGFNLYMEQQWDDALKNFKFIEEKFGAEYTVQLYIERCEKLKNSPPDRQWNGVNHLTEK